MTKALAEKLFTKKIVSRNRYLIDKTLVNQFVFDLLEVLYPHFNRNNISCVDDLNLCIAKNKNLFYELLTNVLSHEDADRITRDFYKKLGEISDLLDLDARAIRDGDPAAGGLDEVISCYPGFLAIYVHRISHFLYRKDIPIIPRLLSEHIHQLTGIDIHPGARIGKSFFIDHGTGVVIGETTVIGNNVKIYQGVTLGALSVDKQLKGKRRHPRIKDNCTIYSGATILGGETVIGRNCIIGGNVWITKSVQDCSIVYHTSQVKFINKKDGDCREEEIS